jgi:hypothetical protein
MTECFHREELQRERIVHFTRLGRREDNRRTKLGFSNALERKRYELHSSTWATPGDSKLFAGHHSISNPLLEMKRITGDVSRFGRCKKRFGKPRTIGKTGDVPSASGHSPLPLGRIFPVERIESFIAVKCESDDPKTETAVKSIRKRLKWVSSLVEHLTKTHKHSIQAQDEKKDISHTSF